MLLAGVICVTAFRADGKKAVGGFFFFFQIYRRSFRPSPLQSTAGSVVFIPLSALWGVVVIVGAVSSVSPGALLSLHLRQPSLSTQVNQWRFLLLLHQIYFH